MEKIKGSLFISVKEIQIIKDCTRSVASIEHRAIRDALGKIKSKYLTVIEYCHYNELDPNEVIRFLNQHR